MAISWNWTDTGVEILNGKPEPTQYCAATGKPEEIAEFFEMVTRIEEALRDLLDARAKITSGEAQYKGALSRILDLHAEISAGNTALISTAYEVDAFFVPMGVAANFHDDPKALSHFIHDAIAHLPALQAKANAKSGSCCGDEEAGE